MSSSLFRQLLWPAAGLILVAVVINTASAAWLAAGRVRQAALARQRSIAELLTTSAFPLTPPVLRQLQGLTGFELGLRSAKDGAVIAETRAGLLEQIGLAGETADIGALRQLSEGSLHEFEGGGYLVVRAVPRGGFGDEVVVCASSETMNAATRQAIIPPLLVGTTTLAALVPLLTWIVGRFVARLRDIEQRCGAIAGGEFGGQLPMDGRSDEITQLARSVNDMSRQLRGFRDELTRTERARLLAQVAAGFAHQLRNGLAGARLALQVHRSRCVNPGDESLEHTIRQLDLVSEEVQTLLSLGKQSLDPPAPMSLTAVATEVERMVLPMCAHRGVKVSTNLQGNPAIVGVVARVRGALLNLVLNAIDAVDTGGTIEIGLEGVEGHALFTVRDSGDGPPEEIANSLFEPFVTSKPEGIGLGLAMVAAVAREHGGEIRWRRDNRTTVFELSLVSKAGSQAGVR